MGALGKITFNTIAAFAGRTLGGLVALASVAFIARSLGPSGFGAYGTIVAYLAIFQILADLGLYTLLTKEIAQKPEKEKELVSQYFTLRLVVAVVFLSIATILVFAFPYSAEIKLGVVFTAVAFLFLSLSQIFLGVFQKHIQVYKAAIAEVLGRVAQLGVVWYFFATDGTLFQYLSALIVGSFIIFVVNLLFVRRIIKFKIKVSTSEWRRIIKTTFPIAISLVFTLLYFKADIILLSVLQSEEDVGIYNAAYKVLETLIFFPAAFMGLMLPVISRYAKEAKEKLPQLLNTLTNIMVLSSLPLVAGGVILSSSFVYIIGGVEFLAATSTMMVLFLAIGIIFFGTLFGNSIIALDLQKKAMKVYFWGFAFNFVANIIFIPQYSYLAAAWTTVLTELLVTLWLIAIIKRKTEIGFSFKIFYKTVFATVVMGGVLLLFTAPIYEPQGILSFALLVLGGAAIFFTAMRLSGVSGDVMKFKRVIG
ncbi:MAG: flippase [Candidatus Spechtbacterales bacterium]